jgi:hypothetical protein
MKLLGRKKQRDHDAFLAYALSVHGILSGEFEWDEMTQELAWEHMQQPKDTLEFICDNPAAANYKLKFSKGHFRLAYYGRGLLGESRAENLTYWFYNLKY